MNKSTLMITIGFLLTFLIGGFTGYLIGSSQEEQAEKTEIRSEQEQRTGNQRGERMRAWISNELGLEEHQEEEFFDLVTKNRRQMQLVLRESQAKANEKLDAHADSLMKDLEQVLTAEQMEIYKERFSREAMVQRQRQRNQQERQRRQLRQDRE